MMNAQSALLQRLRGPITLAPAYPAALDSPCVWTFVLDISDSMAEQDYFPTRYLAAVNSTRHFVATRLARSRKDRFTAVVFNTNPHIVCNGCDADRVEQNLLAPLEDVKPDGGTDLLCGVETAGELLRSQLAGFQQRMIVLTDGYGGNPSEEGCRLKNDGIIIDCVGIGGTRDDVNEDCLKDLASVVSGRIRYRFIGDKDTLTDYFRSIATGLVLP